MAANSKQSSLTHGSCRTSIFGSETSEAIAQMRRGVSVAVVPILADKIGIDSGRLLDLLRLQKRTIARRIQTDGVLSPMEQDRLYRAEKVLVRAVQVLEDGGSAKVWLVRTNRSLSGEIPLALLDTQAGYELVLDTLGRIEHGVLS